MISRHSYMHGNASEPSAAARGAIWMITFGDLLTLLLCFFLVIVSSSPMGRVARGVDSPSPVPAPPGTQVAQVEGETVVREWTIRGVKNESEAPVELQKLAEELISVVRSVPYEKSRVFVRVCNSQGTGADSDTPGVVSLSRITEIRRQILDVGLDASVLEYGFSEQCPKDTVGEPATVAMIQVFQKV
jgi:hypothetical protein